VVLGALIESEAWTMLRHSLERAIEQSAAAHTLRGMSSQAMRERHLLSLLMMFTLDLFKPCALDTYSGTALGLVAGRGRPYSADEMGHTILSFVRLGWTEPLTADVARWATLLWASDTSSQSDHAHAERSAHYLYWDWHVKAVYSDYHIPRTKHGTRQRIIGARKQLMLHDGAGHLLFMRTYRGDTHLIDGMVDSTAYYEGQIQAAELTRQIFDREGLSVAHFKTLLADDHPRQFITCLRSNQYAGVGSFESLTAFKPFRYDRKGNVVQEIAEGIYEMKDRRKEESNLTLRAVLLRKNRGREDEDAHLQVIITPDWHTPATEVAEFYRGRYPQQENAIRDWWLPLGGDVNVGYDKHPVENSELAKQKGELEARLERLERYIPACEARIQCAQRRYDKYDAQYQAEWNAAQQILQQAVQQGQAQGETAWALHQWAKSEEARIEEELPAQQMDAAAEQVEQEHAKQQRYHQQQQQKQQELTKTIQTMADHPMYELDDRKDQLLSVLRLCLLSVLQWLRNAVFPDSYARATYETVKPFIQMGGFVIEHAHSIEVRLDGFWQSAKQRDLEKLVSRCNARQFTAPDGRPLRFGICPKPGEI
jgi:prepilin-type processing-associated H-X9-DG protein